ncbi:MAG TPA: class I SAM-dependent methyltransferase [Gaiellaceae bacterium]|jgi:SAM-dependent methyltransferase
MWTSDSAYDKFMGRFSQRLAPVFADFAGAHGAVLDVGAGTGALTAELVRRDLQVAAVEPASAFVAALRSRFPDVDVRQAPAEELPWPDDSFDVALAQLVVAFMSDAPAGIRQMRRVAETIAVCMWDRERMEMLDAVNRTRDALGVHREDSPYRSREEIEQLFGDGAEVELLEVEAEYADFEDLWSSLLGGAGPAGAWVASLDGEQLQAARAELFRQLDEPEGPFTLTGRAWAARSTRA